MYRKSLSYLKILVCAAFMMVTVSAVSPSAEAADSDVSFDLTVTSDMAYDRYWRIGYQVDGSWTTFESGLIYPVDSSFVSVDLPGSSRYSFRLVSELSFDSSMQYIVFDLPNLYVDGSFYGPASYNFSSAVFHFVNISDSTGERWDYTSLSSYDTSSVYYNSKMHRFLVPVSVVPAGCNGIQLLVNYSTIDAEHIEFYYDQSFAFCVVSTLAGGSVPDGGITEDYLNAALDGQTSSIISQIDSSIDSAVSDNQSWIDDQYSSSVGSLPEDVASANQQITDLNNQEQAYVDDAFSRFQQVSASFSGFDGTVGSGIGLAGTLFSRFFNCLGDYAIIYTFPLILGLAMVIIGRLSRSSFSLEDKDHDQFTIDGW